MSRLSHRVHPVWLVLIGVATLVAGCGQDQSTSPLNPPPDTAPPTAPTDLVVTTQTAAKFRLEWRPCGEPNVVGYTVYRYEPDPSRIMSYVPINQTLIATPSITLSGTPGTTYYFRVAATDITTKESTMSEPLPFLFQASQGGVEFDENGRDNATWHGGPQPGGTDHSAAPYGQGELPTGE